MQQLFNGLTPAKGHQESFFHQAFLSMRGHCPADDAPIRALQDIAPALGRFTVEFGYGDVLSGPALGLKPRQLCTVAALAALGNAAPQLRYHIHGTLNVGWSPREIVEVLILVTVYAGFPAALNGISAAREVFEQRGDKPSGNKIPLENAMVSDRYEQGVRTLQRVSRSGSNAVVESLKDIAPDLGRFIKAKALEI